MRFSYDCLCRFNLLCRQRSRPAEGTVRSAVQEVQYSLALSTGAHAVHVPPTMERELYPVHASITAYLQSAALRAPKLGHDKTEGDGAQKMEFVMISAREGHHTGSSGAILALMHQQAPHSSMRHTCDARIHGD